jgi:DivIVA domain-containing protein
MSLTPEDVANHRFGTVRFKEGYDETEVDAFLDQIVEELRRLHRRIDELEAQQQ